MSAVEAKANLLLAFGISWLLQVYAIPFLFGIQVSAEQGLGIVTLFTVSSFVRQYIVRRGFNRIAASKELERLKAEAERL
jgi:N-acetylglutamate synthase-like GNAT family acetyltransferase